MTRMLGEDNQRSMDNAARDLQTIAQNIDASSNSSTNTSTIPNNIYSLAMFENSPIIVVRWTFPKLDEPKFTYISENISQLGYNSEDILSGNVDWQSILHPDDRRTMKAALETAIKNNKTNFTQTYRLKNVSNAYRWLENPGTIVKDESGNIRYFQALLTDITDRKAVEAELHQKTTYLEILHKTSLGLMQRLDLKSLFDLLVKDLKDVLDIDFAMLYLFNQNQERLELAAAKGMDALALGTTVEPNEGLVGMVWQTNEATYLENYQWWSNRINRAVFDSIGSVAAVPLANSDDVYGVLSFGSNNIIQFDANTKTLLKSFAQIASIAIDNAILFQNAQNELAERETLEKNLESERNALAKQTQFRTELASLVADSLSGKLAGDFYQSILERAIAIIPGAEAGSLLVKGRSERFQFEATVGYDPAPLENVRFKESEIYRDLRNTEPLRIFEVDRERLSSKNLSEIESAQIKEFQVALTIPIHLYNEPVALFSLDSLTNKDAFDDETVHLAKIFANQVTAVWQRFVLEKDLKKNQHNYRHLFLEANQYSKELQILDKIRSVIASKLELNGLLDTVCKSMAEIFGYGRVSIGMVKDDHVVTVASYGSDKTIVLPDTLHIETSIFQRIQKSKEVFVFPKDHAAFNSVFKEDSENKTMMLLPLISQDNVRGLMAVACESRNIGKSEKALLNKIVDQLQIAIDNATLHNRVKNDLLRTKALYKVSNAMQENTHVDNYMDAIIEHIREALGSNWAVIYKMNFEHGRVEHISRAHFEAEPLEPLNFIQLNSGLTGWAIQHQEPVYTTNASEDERENKVVSALNQSLAIGSALVIPLIYQNEIYGTLATLNKKSSQQFSSEDLDLLVAIANQATVALAQYELRKTIDFQAFHDTLTKLPNRIYIENQLDATILEAKKQQSSFATMFLDLDGFKHVNDTLGHNIGDELLKAVANRLRENTPRKNILARMGGDEFALIVKTLGTDEKASALEIAESYLTILNKAFQIGKHTIKVGASIGISLYPYDGQTLSSLLKHADSAMYQAKYSGKNSARLFTAELAAKVQERIELENDLRQVIEVGGLELYYQPQICLQKNKRIGVEALLRWNHPTKGYISPDDFIPVSEESKLILDIGKWVLHEACNQNAAWQAEGYEPMTIAVNISAIQFESADFIQTVTTALEESGLDPSYLELEVTESVIMQDVDTIIDSLNALRAIGVKMSIDDFGTGYSSLQYLQKLPLDKLKIDKTFVNDISQNNTPIITSIFILAQSLGLTTVAEGVETKEELDFVRMLGCDEVQGYYFSKAVPASEIWTSSTFKNPTVNELMTKSEKVETVISIEQEAA